MYGRWLQFVNAELHVDESHVIIPPTEITSATTNFRKSGDDKRPNDLVNQNENSASDRLASTSIFKAKKERRHHGGKYGWTGYISWVFVLQNFFSIYAIAAPADAEQCAFGLKTPGRTWPSGDIVLEHGQPLRIYCMLNENLTDEKYRDRNASDLEFFRSSTSVEPEYITVVNKTTIMMHVDQPSPSDDMYFCKLKLNDSHSGRQYEAVCLNSVVIGFKPQEPLNFSCVSYNWEKLVCTWTPAPNYIETQFSLAFRLPGRTGRSMFPCIEPQTESNLPPNTCFWDSTTHPHYRQVYEYYKFTLTAENVLGTTRFSYTFHHWAHVIPSKPNNLSVIKKTSSSALLHWSVPWPMETFPPGLHHRVSYKNQLDSEETWKTIDITNEKYSPEIYFNLTDLHHANTAYTVKVSLRSSVAVDEDKWGQFSEVFFKTDPTLPGLPPKTDIGSFEISGNSDSRDVYIYWQTIPQYLENGDNFTYQIVRVEENGISLDIQPHEVTKTYAKFQGISLNSLTFYIVAANCKGANEQKATVRVPRQLEMPQKPLVFTKIAFDEGIYELSWNSSGNSDIVDYTIFWCENDRDRPYQCSGYLDWVRIPQNVRIHNVTVPDPKKVYQFAISANTEQASSGMAWVSSITTLSNAIGKMKSVWITRIESDLIQVGWDLEYSGRIGIIESFNIHHCPIVSANNLTCNGPKMITTVTSAPHTLHGVIRNLRPRTTYIITVAVMTKNGEGLHSDALYITTLKTALVNVIDTPPKPASDLSDLNVSTEIRQGSHIANDIVEETKQECNEDVDRRLDLIDKHNFDSADCIRQVSNLTEIISAYEKELNFLLDRDRKLRDSLLRCNEVW